MFPCYAACDFRVRFQTRVWMTPVPLYFFFPQHHTPSHGFPEIELESCVTHNPPSHKVISKISGLKKTEGNRAGNPPRCGNLLYNVYEASCPPPNMSRDQEPITSRGAQQDGRRPVIQLLIMWMLRPKERVCYLRSHLERPLG